MNITQQIMCLFPGFQTQTKKEYREKIYTELGIIPSPKARKSRSVTIELLDENNYDQFSSNFSAEKVGAKSLMPQFEEPEAQEYEAFTLSLVPDEILEPEPVEQGKEWTPVEIATLHEGLIIEMLKDIRDKRIKNDRIAEWLCWAEGMESEFGHPLPFSFEACCIFSNFDPDSFRHRMSYVLRQHRGWKICWRERDH